jgi:hypothetical protein
VNHRAINMLAWLKDIFSPDTGGKAGERGEKIADA